MGDDDFELPPEERYKHWLEHWGIPRRHLEPLTEFIGAQLTEERRKALEQAADYIDERGMGYINASNRPENGHAAVRLHKAGTVLREESRRLRALAQEEPKP